MLRDNVRPAIWFRRVAASVALFNAYFLHFLSIPSVCRSRVSRLQSLSVICARVAALVPFSFSPSAVCATYNVQLVASPKNYTPN